MRSRLVVFIAIICLAFSAVARASTAPSWQWQSPVVQWNILNAAADGDGQFVAVGQSGTILTSPDGKHWTLRSSGIPTASLVDVAYGGGTWVAVGEADRIAGDQMERIAVLLTSPDGMTWTVSQRLEQAALQHVVYGGGRFLVLGFVYTTGESQRIQLISIDGATWERHDQPGLSGYGVAYGAGLFVAATSTGINSSVDGITWQDRFTLPEGRFVEAIAYTGSQFVAVGGRGDQTGAYVLTSGDGVTWQPHSVRDVKNLHRIAAGAGRIVALGDGGTLYASVDGDTWTTEAERPRNYVGGVACSTSVCVAVNGSEILTSGADGRWESNQNGIGEGLGGIIYEDGEFFAIRDGRLFRTADGLAWSDAGAVLGKGEPWEGYVRAVSVAYGNGRYVAQGQLNLDEFLYLSTDGKTWQKTYGEYFPMGAMSLRYVGERFFYHDRTSTDGEHWDQMSGFTGHMLDLAFGHGRYLALGDMGQVARSSDGITWSPVDTGLQPDPTWSTKSLAYGGGKFLLARSDLQKLMVSPDGETWTETPWPFARQAPGITYGGGLFLATASDGVWTSSDGVMWTTVAGIPDGAGVSVAYGKGKFVAVGAGGPVFTGQVCGSAFPDLPAQHPACDPVELLAARQVISGFPDGSFRPDAPVTRAELTKLLAVLLHRITVPGDRAPFADTANHWAAQQGYIQTMVALGAVNGFPDGTFRPDDPVTRGQLIKIVSALTGLKPGGGISYKDVATSDWYAGWVGAASSGRLIGWGAPFPVWTGDTLQAETPVTRAEAAMVLANLAER